MLEILYILAALFVLVCAFTSGVNMGRSLASIESKEALYLDERRLMAVELEYKALKEQDNNMR